MGLHSCGFCILRWFTIQKQRKLKGCIYSVICLCFFNLLMIIEIWLLLVWWYDSNVVENVCRISRKGYLFFVSCWDMPRANILYGRCKIGEVCQLIAMPIDIDRVFSGGVYTVCCRYVYRLISIWDTCRFAFSIFCLR